MLPKLSISHLSKSFNNLEVLRDISLHVVQGEFVSLIGQSGCGKTTIFDIISGIENQTSGKIIIDGKEDPPLSLSAELRRGKAGYMLQQALLLPWRTVLENVLLGLDIKNESKKISQRKALFLLKEFGLDKFSQFYPFALSGGMKQRIALLRTILFNKDLLLLDEPFGQLDALTRLSCQMWLMSVWSKFNSSILFITHDTREAIFLSDRIYVLSPLPGKIIKELIVDLPRPRTPELLINKNAEELEKKLLKLLGPNS